MADVFYKSPGSTVSKGTKFSVGKVSFKCIKQGVIQKGTFDDTLSDGATFTDGGAEFVIGVSHYPEFVKSVNGAAPDGNGDVCVDIEPKYDLIYPVGSIYMSVNSTDPQSLFGGVWQALNEGRVLLGAGAQYAAGGKGGTSTVTLSEEQLPSHTHNVQIHEAGSHTHTVGTSQSISVLTPREGNIGVFNSSDVESHADVNISDLINNIEPAGAHTHTTEIGSTGGSQAFSIMQPWLAVYMWVRME